MTFSPRFSGAFRPLLAPISAYIALKNPFLRGSEKMSAKAQKEPANVYDFTVLQYGQRVSLGKYKGKVTAIVNVASE